MSFDLMVSDLFPTLSVLPSSDMVHPCAAAYSFSSAPAAAGTGRSKGRGVRPGGKGGVLKRRAVRWGCLTAEAAEHLCRDRRHNLLVRHANNVRHVWGEKGG